MTEIINRVDADGNGYIDYTEFLCAAINRERLLSIEVLEAAFASFDTDSSGSIDMHELKAVLGAEDIEDTVWKELI